MKNAGRYVQHCFAFDCTVALRVAVTLTCLTVFRGVFEGLFDQVTFVQLLVGQPVGYATAALPVDSRGICNCITIVAKTVEIFRVTLIKLVFNATGRKDLRSRLVLHFSGLECYEKFWQQL